MEKIDLLKSHIEAYTRKDGTVVQAHDDRRNAKQAKASVPPISAHANDLRRSTEPGDMDHEDNQFAASYMDKDDHEGLSDHLKHLDTAARDHILDHIHPAHREKMGYKQTNMDRSLREFNKKFGKKAHTESDLGQHKVGDTVSYKGERGTRTGKVKGVRDGKVVVEHKAGYTELKHHSELSAAKQPAPNAAGIAISDLHKEHAVKSGAKSASGVSVFRDAGMAQENANRNTKAAVVMKHPDMSHHVVVNLADAARLERNGYQHVKPGKG